MAKWFVSLTVFAVCFLGIYGQNDTFNATDSDEISYADTTDEPTYPPTKLQAMKDEHIGNVTTKSDEDVGNKHKHPSTFPPLVHNPDPQSGTTTEEPPKVISTEKVAKSDNLPVTMPTTTTSTTTTTKAPASITGSTAKKDGKNSSNVQQGSLIVLALCYLAARFSY